ncbi:hypothetical protein BMF89_07380 [Arthrobacter sp. SRS-W-1-2016]|uniref:hypothetical protein n=1 Tax=Arthrobacter sp. SRS-W-1-2016 TaxID=1930254 RepID=UPI0009910E2F|nr:hypothetical protein [Arthrobacter sp. SRS-W-1-2016]OOP63104.1 hypothetical protein BMF89_07380 [Arthrobacter sp. SRS-W-1-2016]
MTKQCECSQRRWALPNLVVNLIRLAFAICAWGIMHGATPAVVLHLAVNLFPMSVAILIAVWGVLL